ncbi:fam-b protein [Plasmodium yoelii]|uniref:Fam-b protein n=2 Tax=Plasmodium yoelii TaxID=5861 RepID=A0AAE9WV58_PLAYO|nr:fam-b protein [Plasmodium yoelii]WBY57083.1 fam-b protein [Plasmodium yoelii yoelii]CDU17783.1 fam-b protein [Plasmodium yoelii]VTZ78200.1 fam-b protein [Plasmodium yoelii]|eukprot:XP_022812090.1 fam-b protein [Plasmodium yoelii]
MRVAILKYVLFSIVICSFEYAKNELYLVNERNIYHERNITNFRNNRILADTDNQFDLNEFYQSILSLADQFNEYNVDDEKIIYLRNIINSHVKKHKENNTLPNLNNVNRKTKKLIDELRKELEEVKKELDNKRNDELPIQQIQDKRITKKDKNTYVLEQKDFKHLENYENILETEDGKIENEYNEITSNNNYKEPKTNRKFKKVKKKLFKMMITSSTFLAIILSSGLAIPFMLLITQDLFDGIKNWWEIYELNIKK